MASPFRLIESPRLVMAAEVASASREVCAISSRNACSSGDTPVMLLLISVKPTAIAVSGARTSPACTAVPLRMVDIYAVTPPAFWTVAAKLPNASTPLPTVLTTCPETFSSGPAAAVRTRMRATRFFVESSRLLNQVTPSCTPFVRFRICGMSASPMLMAASSSPDFRMVSWPFRLSCIASAIFFAVPVLFFISFWTVRIALMASSASRLYSICRYSCVSSAVFPRSSRLNMMSLTRPSTSPPSVSAYLPQATPFCSTAFAISVAS